MRASLQEWKKRSFGICILLAVTCLIQPLQSQVSVHLTQPPTNQLRVADLWRLSVTNSSASIKRVYMQGLVRERQSGEIVRATTKSFVLKPGESKVFNPSTVPSSTVQWSNVRYKNILTTSGQAPSGNYTICISVFDESTAIELGSDCIEQSVEIASSIELSAPEDEAVLSGSTEVFSWLPPSVNPGQLRYVLRIYDLRNQQSAKEFISSGSAVLTNQNVNTNSFVLGIASRGLRAGRRYAWQVEARSGDLLIASSEVRFFKVAAAERKMISRQKAIDIILKTILVPPTLNHRVTVYLGMEVSPIGAVVQPFMIDDKRRTLTQPTWFAWINDDPTAYFEHPTRFVYINAYTGEFEIQNEGWWPVVNGESLWMHNEEKSNPSVLIYSDVHLK